MRIFSGLHGLAGGYEGGKRVGLSDSGQHYDHDDEHGFYFGHTRTAEQIRRYVDSAVKGMETGMFVYLAHPDLFMRDYGRPLDADGARLQKELCQACKALNMPRDTTCTTVFFRRLRTERVIPTRISLTSFVRRACVC